MLWYGMKTGLSLREAWTVPYSFLLDLSAMEQIKHEGAELKPTAAEEQDEFMQMLLLK